VRGTDSICTANAMLTLGRALDKDGQYDEALPLFDRARETYERLDGPDDVQAMQARSYRGHALMGLGQFDEAEMELKAALARFGGDHPFAKRRRKEINAWLEELVLRRNNRDQPGT